MSLLDKASLIVTPNSYKESKLYSVIPSSGAGDMDVVRATTATRVNSAGLIEVVPRNLLTYSEQFDNSDWLSGGSGAFTITVNSTNAPNGTLTADKLIAPLTNQTIRQNKASITTNCTLSVYLKTNSGTRQMRLFINDNQIESIVNVTSDWQRFTLSGTTGGTLIGSGRVGLSNVDILNESSFVYIWGAQFENFATATEYFPTTTRLNIPRIDYTNGSCPSLLVEPQRTNLLTYSNDFSNVIWAKVASSTVTTDSGVQNPSGVSPTFRFNASNLAFGGILRQILTLTVGQTYTFSYFAKKGNYRYVGIRFNNARNGERFPTYDFDTDTLNKQGATCDLSRTILTNGWVKLTITFTATIITSNCDIALTTSNGDTSTALSGTEFVYIFGAQTELSSFGTSYIPTVASTVTRNADVISKTGISSLINSQQGVLFVDLQFFTGLGGIRSINISNGSNNNRIGFYGHPSIANRIDFAIASGGTITDINFNGVTLTNRNKVLIRYSGTTFTAFVNGVKSANQTFTPFAANFLNRIGLDYGEDILRYEGRINSIQLYKTALTDAECIALTTL